MPLSASTRADDDDFDEYWYDLFGDADITYTEISGVHPKIYRGYCTMKNTHFDIEYPSTGREFSLLDLKLDGIKLYFDVLIWPFESQFTFYNPNKVKLMAISIRTDGPILAMMNPGQFQQNLKRMLPEVMRDIDMGQFFKAATVDATVYHEGWDF